jgi:hypothetical protein
MRQPNPTQRRELGDTLADLAEQTAMAIARAAALAIQPPVAVLLAERDLAAWARALHATGAARPRTPGSREVLVGLLVMVADDRDPAALAEAVVRTAGRAGQGWRVTHVTAALDPTRLRSPANRSEEDRR